MILRIEESRAFKKQWPKVLTPEERADLDRYLHVAPDAGAVMPRMAGLRKLRLRARGRGKSGGARVIYYWESPDGSGVALLRIFARSRSGDMSESDAKRLRRAAEEILS